MIAKACYIYDMKHIISINDQTKQGKALLAMLKTLPPNTVEFFEDKEADTVPAEEFFDKLEKEVEKRFASNQK